MSGSSFAGVSRSVTCLPHKMGIIDDAYIRATSDQGATVGRKVSISVDEVTALVNHVRKLGRYLTTELDALL